MKTLVKIGIVVLLLITIKVTFFLPANCKVTTKLDMIENEISKRGYVNNWFVISGKRSSWYNDLLFNSAKKSHHLSGNAIDIYVFDIDGDGVFTQKDIKIFESATKYVESNYPELVGGLGTYTNRGYFSSHMIHVDTRGYKSRYNY